MIQTDTNTHLFIHDENMRQLLKYKDGRFITSKSEKSYSKEDLFNIIENEPERISIMLLLVQLWKSGYLILLHLLVDQAK